ncbi:MAG: hypothetical protein ACRDY7_05580, partial [Acidimicrobiia bacterium]
MPRPRALAVGVCLAVAAATAPPIASAAERGEARDLERKREDARRRQGEVSQALDVAHASEAELTARLRRIALDLAGKHKLAERARQEAEASAASVGDIRAEVASLRATLDRRRAVFNRRAVQAYMGGEGRPLDDLAVAGELLSLPEDFSQAARRAALVAQVSHQDGNVLEDLSATRSRLATRELTLVLARDEAGAR